MNHMAEINESGGPDTLVENKLFEIDEMIRGRKGDLQ
jgi:hypothetical protein